MKRSRDWLVLAALGAAAWVVYFPVLSIRPFTNDNLYSLAWVDAVPAARLFVVDPAISPDYPEWRPLPYLMLWLEHRAVTLQHVGVHFGVNLALWVSCAWAVYFATRQLAESQLAGLAAAFIVLVDPRATSAVTNIIDRQSSLACLFGLTAVALTARAQERHLGAAARGGLTALLLAAAISKEYGLSFAMAMAIYGWWRRRPDFLWPAATAGVLYALIRTLSASGQAEAFCEEMYYFSHAAERCIDPLRGDGLAQMAYNIGATLMNLPLRGLFSGVGQPMISELMLAAGVVFSGLVVLALAKGPAFAWMLIMVPLANALLSFLIYRERNQLVGACALAILSGLGLALATRLVLSPARRYATAVGIAVLVAAQASVAHRFVTDERDGAAAIDPCTTEIHQRPLVPPMVARLKARYGLTDPDCRGNGGR